MSTNATSRLIAYKELKPLKGIKYSRMQLRRLVKARKFPQPVPISGHYQPWYEHEIDQWVAEKAAARLTNSPPPK